MTTWTQRVEQPQCWKPRSALHPVYLCKAVIYIIKLKSIESQKRET